MYLRQTVKTLKPNEIAQDAFITISLVVIVLNHCNTARWIVWNIGQTHRSAPTKRTACPLDCMEYRADTQVCPYKTDGLPVVSYGI